MEDEQYMLKKHQQPVTHTHSLPKPTTVREVKGSEGGTRLRKNRTMEDEQLTLKKHKQPVNHTHVLP
jgi:hypothetical protein